jgi:hypothetical protein
VVVPGLYRDAAAIETKREFSHGKRAYYTTVFRQPAPAIWEIIRDFNNNPVWVEGAGESLIAHGKSGDAVGAVRSVLYRRPNIRQRLLTIRNALRASSFAARRHCRGGLCVRVTPVVDGDRSFVEWWAGFRL